MWYKFYKNIFKNRWYQKYKIYTFLAFEKRVSYIFPWKWKLFATIITYFHITVSHFFFYFLFLIKHISCIKIINFWKCYSQQYNFTPSNKYPKSIYLTQKMCCLSLTLYQDSKTKHMPFTISAKTKNNRHLKNKTP